MLVKVYASGTNVQRLAKGSGKADGVIYTAYSQLEQTENSVVKRRFFMLEVDQLKQEVESLDEKVQPSWTKIWAKPNGNKSFVGKLFSSLVGEEPLRQELNLDNLTGESIDCFMVLVSANNREMSQIKNIANRVIPEYHVKILNGEFTSNKEAQYETRKEINQARLAGKKGVIIIANQMGSRSYSIPEIQATVIAYDRGSVDATMQKVSRCLTPGNTYRGEPKEYGHIIDLSFDPNRSENIERVLIDEIIQLSKSEGIDFPSAITYVLSSIDCFRVKYGTAVEVDEAVLFDLLGDNENLLRVADVSVDVAAALDLIDALSDIKAMGKTSKKQRAAIDNVKNTIREGSFQNRQPTDSEKREVEKIINNAVRTLNMSATSVYNLAGGGSSYRECIQLIAENIQESEEFQELFGVTPDIVEMILDRELLNEPVLDVIVQNSARNKNTGMKFVTDLSRGILGQPDNEEMWKHIIDQIPDEVFLRENIRILCVAFGHGTEASVIRNRMLSLGIDSDTIMNSIHVLDKYRVFTKEAARQGYVNVIQENFIDWETDMKFDVIVGNPPYNSNDTQRVDTNHRGQGDNLAKKFALKSLDLATDYMFFIMPYGHRTYSPALQEHYRKNGLYQIESCEHYFTHVSTNPAVFMFDKNQVVDEVNDLFFDPGIDIPENNIGKIFKNQPGKLNRADYEHNLVDRGNYRIVVTTAVSGYTDDETIVDAMQDSTRGNWRVVFNCTTSKKKIGKIIVEGPDSVLSKSVHCLILNSEEQAMAMKEYLESDTVSDIIKQVKTINACNSKKYLQYVPMLAFDD